MEPIINQMQALITSQSRTIEELKAENQKVIKENKDQHEKTKPPQNQHLEELKEQQ
jgi:hypothetical protein